MVGLDKKCCKCKVEKPISGFHKDKHNKDGVSRACKLCRSEYGKKHHQKNSARNNARGRKYYLENTEKFKSLGKEYRSKNKEKLRVRHKKYRMENPESQRNATCRRLYGIDLTWIREQLGQQLWRCAICGIPINLKSLHVDHCHGSGKARGLLCRHCNIGLGHFIDNEHVLLNAVGYLRMYKKGGE